MLHDTQLRLRVPLGVVANGLGDDIPLGALFLVKIDRTRWISRLLRWVPRIVVRKSVLPGPVSGPRRVPIPSVVPL